MKIQPTTTRSRLVEELLARPGLRGVLIAASRDPDAKLTFVVTAPGSDSGRLAVKIPSTALAAQSVEHEGRLLTELRRLPLGELVASIPRYVESLQVDGRMVLVSTALPGTAMSVRYHQWLHTSRPRAVGTDFRLAADWLAGFQRVTSHAGGRVDWAAQTADTLRGRWDGHPRLDDVLERLDAADDRLRVHDCVQTAVHGDYWFGNLLVENGSVTGVVDWEAGSTSGTPLSDLARFPLSYSLYLDRHTRPGRAVLGHPGLRRNGFGQGLMHALAGRGWYPEIVRSFLTAGLVRLKLPPTLWYDVALTGVAEIAASANDAEFGASHLSLLADLPLHPRRLRR